MWMRNEAMRRLVSRNRFVRFLTFGLHNALQMKLLGGHKHPVTLRRLNKARSGTDSLLSSDEAFVLHELAHAQAVYEGDLAEFGVYRGASAELLCMVKAHRTLHLFDTFEGLPAPKGKEGKVFAKGEFHGSLESVRQKLAGYENVAFHPGFFPDSASSLGDERYSFVHLDVDLYEATLAGLAYFYPRMIPGGIILTHDYSIIDGVSQAFAEYLADKPEHVIELPTTQAMIIRQGQTL
ncbi:TylF/MycF/NovP-related O-methyltransferase [Asaia astilbis]|uniref:TylF/MycF/NovP-related O-methyltransferase n=1 Tax=Asaia astilbis TaxID=610244 RepID=UPI00046FF8B3|nr:TylF/MycF/NovP-related O-methyltransferase [Asaia astilbis]